MLEETARPNEYRFSHALVQETLLDEVRTSERVRLHGRIADALERLHGDRAVDYAAEIARHFAESATLSGEHGRRALHYSSLAAEQAEAQFAWDEAARHYEDCLAMLSEGGTRPGGDEAALHEHDDLRDGDEAALCEAVGRCEMLAGQYDAGWRNLRQAIALFRERGDGIGEARAVLLIPGFGIPTAEEVVRVVDAALDSLGAGAPHLRARLLAARASTELDGDQEAADEAVVLATAHGFDDVLATLLHHQAQRSFGHLPTGETGRLTRQAHAALVDAGAPREAAWALVWAVLASLLGGRLDETETQALEAASYAHEVGSFDYEQQFLW